MYSLSSMKSRLTICFLSFALLSMGVNPLYASSIAQQKIEFSDGSNVTFVSSSLRGDQIIDYLVEVSKGQYMNISLGSKHPSIYFNVLTPGSENEAIFIGSTRGNQFESTAQNSGEYRVRVYLMRSAARRDEQADYGLELIIGEGTPPTHHAKHDAKVPGTEFHAVGEVGCQLNPCNAMERCRFGVKRLGQGKAIVSIDLPNGGNRTIHFENGLAQSFETSAGLDRNLNSERQHDTMIVQIDDEKYEIPDIVIYGD